MRANDLVNHLATYLPQFVDDFTTSFTVSSLTRSGTTVTGTTTTDHGLATGQQANIVGAITPIVITSLTRSGIVGTIVTDSDHDITENDGFTVQIEGATEASFNGEFVLSSVPNRRELTFIMPDSGPVTATGSPLLLSGSNIFQSYNGLREITSVPTATTFTYSVSSDTLYTPARGTPILKTSPRISASVSFDRLFEAYTKQEVGAAWLFVVLGDAVANKNRAIDIDSTDNIQSGNYFNQRLTQSVSVFVFLPTSNTLAGRQARDRCEELLSPICQSLLRVKFPSLVENDNNPLMFNSHGFQAYTRSVYVHQYVFETTLQLGPSDAFVPSDDVAFRDIALTIGLDLGTETFETLIDLDDTPV